MVAETIIIDNRSVSIEEAAQLLTEAGEQLDQSELAGLVETVRREQPPGSRTYFLSCEHGSYAVTRLPGSRRPDAEGVRRAVAGLHDAYRCHCGDEIAARYRRRSHP